MNTQQISPILYRILSAGTVLLLALSSFGGALAQAPTTYVVNTTDDVDDGTCNKAHCSLHEAIEAANANLAADKIVFKIPGGPPFTIQPGSALPEITDPVTIDGTTQPGFHGNPIIELDGTNAGEGVPDEGISGLVISAGGSTVRSLVINRFSGVGIVLTTNGGNTIQGNFIGTDVTGTLASGNAQQGIVVADGSSGNFIGGNLISGNGAAGIRLSGAGTDGNNVQGNLIGIDITGTSPLGNGLVSETPGIRVTEGAADNVIGGTEDGARNIISGNGDSGVIIEGDGTSGNTVQGNYIGTDATGSSTIGPDPGEFEVTLEEGCPTYPAGTIYDDWESGSDDPLAPWSWISVHFLGTDECGSPEILNGASLIYRYRLEFTEDTQLNSIAISGAGFYGPNSVLRVLDEDMNVLGTADTFGDNSFQIYFVTLQSVVGKVFFIDEFDTSTTWRFRQSIVVNVSPLGNYGAGVAIWDLASDNLVIGNLISGNAKDGVIIVDPGTTSNTLQDNIISGNASTGIFIADSEKTLIVGNEVSDNRSDGIWLGGVNSITNGNVIGGTADEERNVISGNGHFGVSLNEAATANLILGNFIGTDETGTLPFGNDWGGVFLGSEANHNTIGGTQAGAGNLISGNGGEGVKIADPGTSENIFQGNFIGTDAYGAAALPNADVGVRIGSGASNTLIGGTEDGARNVISGNGGDGVKIADPGTSENKVQGNFIGTDITGTSPLGNGTQGIELSDGATNNEIGGTPDGARNVISGNSFAGIFIYGDGTTGNTVQGNYIGTDRDGSGALANSAIGVLLIGDATGNLIGGTEDGARNVISGNPYNVIFSVGGGTTGNTLQGNFIGLDSTGSKALANTDIGVVIFEGASNNLIGGTDPGAGNFISGSARWGVAIGGSGVTGNVVQGNSIGTDASGTKPLGNLSGGVIIDDGAAGNLIGGTEPGAGNTIAFNAGAGITLGPFEQGPTAGSGNALLSNSVYSNGGLGIDLGGDGLVTPNDPLDLDTGPNGLQNFPIITAVRRVGKLVMIFGTLDSAPSTKFRLEFFSNDACDPSGYGEGQAFLGSAHVKTNQAGSWSFIITLPASLPEGAFVTATATDPGGSTSEFSNCFGP